MAAELSRDPQKAARWRTAEVDAAISVAEIRLGAEQMSMDRDVGGPARFGETVAGEESSGWAHHHQQLASGIVGDGLDSMMDE